MLQELRHHMLLLLVVAVVQMLVVALLHLVHYVVQQAVEVDNQLQELMIHLVMADLVDLDLVAI
jgi:hypothetical protein